MNRRVPSGTPLSQDTMTHDEMGDTMEDALLALIAEGLAPIEPPPDRRAAMRQRILANATAAPASPRAATATVTVHPDEGAWRPVFPGVTMKMLHDHGEAQSFLLRLEPGARVPVHGHGSDELCVVLEGEVCLNGVQARAGTFHLALAGSEHSEVTTETGCLLYLKADLEHGVLFR